MTTADRRAEDSAVILLLRDVLDNQKQLADDLSQHMLAEEKSIAVAITEALSRAFPDGDADSHRRRHEADLLRTESRAAFWKKLLDELSQKGLLLFIGWVLYVGGTAMWAAFVAGPHGK